MRHLSKLGLLIVLPLWFGCSGGGGLSDGGGGGGGGGGGSRKSQQTPTVRDGVGVDIQSQPETDMLAANWEGFGDVDHYEWALGSTPLGTDVRGWTAVDGEFGQAFGLTLVREQTYYASVRAVIDGEPGAAVASDGVKVDAGPKKNKPKLGRLSDDMVALARRAKLIWFDAKLKGGAHTWVFEGGEFAKAAIAFTGDTRADTELLAQIRYVLRPGSGLTCTGGFQDQKQLGTTTMFLLAQRTPRIWNALTANERAKIEAMVFAALVSSAFTTSDHNPFVKGGKQQRTMDGGSNVNREWNPNYRNGMLGTVIVGSLFFGPKAAQARLKAHDHDAFIKQLRGLDLTNVVGTYTASNSNRPTSAMIEATLKQDYVYKSIPLTNLMGIFLHVTDHTYSRSITKGLNGGAGKVGTNNVRGGYMVKNRDKLPNVGKPGMLREFNGVDAGGPRSAAHYANDGWYVNNYIHYALLATESWVDSAKAREILTRIGIGTGDLRYKIDPALGGGYHDFQKGKGSGSAYTITDKYGHRLNFAIAKVLADFHAK